MKKTIYILSVSLFTFLFLSYDIYIYINYTSCWWILIEIMVIYKALLILFILNIYFLFELIKINIVAISYNYDAFHILCYFGKE